MIPIYKPLVLQESARKALDSGWISSQGEYIQKTTDLCKKVFNIPYVILMNNGTSATHMLLKALKFKYPTIRKIYVPNNVFVAVWNVILYEDYEMEVMEMDPNTLNMRTDKNYINQLETDSAVFIVHNVGNIIHVPRLKSIRPDLVFIEDNCEGLFGKYDGIYSGMSEAALCSSCSFFANKIITSGEGGAFFTHDKDIYDYIYSTIHHGLSPKKFIFENLGYNYRMTNIQAALLFDQLENISSILEKKRFIFSQYESLLDNLDVYIPQKEKNTDKADWIFILGCKKSYADIETVMKTKNIEIRPFFYDINDHTHLQNIPCSSKLTFNYTFFMIPSFPELTNSEINYICESIKELLSG